MYWTLVKTGLVRRRLRTFLTIMSMFVAFVLYGSLNALSGLFTGSLDGLSDNNIIVMPRYDFISGKLPVSHVNFIETLDGVEELVAKYNSFEDSLDFLVNNAGAAWGEAYDEFPEVGWDKVMDLNVKSLFFLTQKLTEKLKLKALKKQ